MAQPRGIERQSLGVTPVADEFSDLSFSIGSACTTALPASIKTETPTMPTNDGFGLDDCAVEVPSRRVVPGPLHSRARRGPAPASDVEEIFQRGSDFLNQRLRKRAKFPVKERVVPSQNLVHKNIAISFHPAGAFWDAHSQREGVVFHDSCGERQNHSAFETSLAKFRRLDRETGPLFAGFCANPRFQINDVDMPAARKQD